jgi:hypothetical protein
MQIKVISDIVFIYLYSLDTMIEVFTSIKNSWPSKSQNHEIQPDPDSLSSSSYKLSI